MTKDAAQYLTANSPGPVDRKTRDPVLSSFQAAGLAAPLGMTKERDRGKTSAALILL